MRLGYQFGVKMNIQENLTAGITFRSGLSGLSAVMLQEIPSRAGLMPGLQEAYLTWRTPYLTMELGKIPQAGNAMWDIYAATIKWDMQNKDFRENDPRDAIFNDRMAALNGIRLSRKIAFFTLRGLFHEDLVSGSNTKLENSVVDFQRTRDINVVMLGTTIDLEQAFCPMEGCGGCGGESSGGGCCGKKETSVLGRLKCVATEGVTIDFDYGIPYRQVQLNSNIDSVYAAETIWGATFKKSVEMGTLQVGYGYNWRDKIYTMNYLDVLAQHKPLYFGESVGDLIISARYQHSTDKRDFPVEYAGSTIDGSAWHFYLNRTVWGLDLQPRVIIFDKKTEGFKQEQQVRYELTGTIRF